MRIVNRIEMDGGEQLGRHLSFLDRGATEEQDEEMHDVNSSRMTVRWREEYVNEGLPYAF